MVLDKAPLIVPELLIVIPPLKVAVLAESERFAPAELVKVTGLPVVMVDVVANVILPALFHVVPPLMVTEAEVTLMLPPA
jgi:hypothetical protein